MDNKPKKLHTTRKGLLTDTERTAINKNMINKDIQHNLFDIKNGILINNLDNIAKDLEIILNNRNLEKWVYDFTVQSKLQEIQSIITKHFEFYVRPVYKIAVKTKNKKQLFYLKILSYNEITVKDSKSTGQIITKIFAGLKPNERNTIQKFILKKGFNFPLEVEREYTWNEVSTILKNKILEEPQITKEITDEFNDRMNKAKKMIDSKISKEEQQKIIKETGFGIKLEQYRQMI